MIRWPWRYARLWFQIVSSARDVEVKAQAAPTRWGPWGLLTPEEMERVQPDVERIVRMLQTMPYIGGEAEALVRILPRKERE